MVHSAHIRPYQWTVFYPPVLVCQSKKYTQDTNYNIPVHWLVHYSLSGYMDHDRWIKSMSHLSSICCSSPLNTQLILYDGRDVHFDDRSLNILRSHHIKDFILKVGEYLHDQPNNNGPNLNLNNIYNNSRMKWTRKNGTLKFTPAHMNAILV